MLQHQHVSLPITCDIFVSLHEMFGGKGKLARQAIVKAIIDTKMSEGTLIRGQMICIIDFLMIWRSLKLRSWGTQVNMVLKALPNSFK